MGPQFVDRHAQRGELIVHARFHAAVPEVVAVPHLDPEIDPELVHRLVLPERLDDLVAGHDPVRRELEGMVGLVGGRHGDHDIGIGHLRRAHHIDDHEEIDLLERLDDPFRAPGADRRLGARRDDGPDRIGFLRQDAVEGPVVGRRGPLAKGLEGAGETPAPTSLSTHSWVYRSRRCTFFGVGIVLPTGDDVAAGPVQIAGDRDQDGDRPSSAACRCGVLDAVAEIDRRRLGLRIEPGEVGDLAGRYPGDRLRPGGGILLQVIPQFFKAIAPLGNEGLIVKLFVDDDMQHGQCQSGVRTRPDRNPLIRQGDIRFQGGLDRDEAGAALLGIDELLGIPLAGAGIDRLLAPDQDQLAVLVVRRPAWDAVPSV